MSGDRPKQAFENERRRLERAAAVIRETMSSEGGAGAAAPEFEVLEKSARTAAVGALDAVLAGAEGGRAPVGAVAAELTRMAAETARLAGEMRRAEGSARRRQPSPERVG
jgi:hypothetical protein